MKPTLLALLLASSLAFGQKLQDVSAKGSPVSLGIKHDEDGPYVAIRNNSSKGILAYVAVTKATDDHGKTMTPCRTLADNAFKSSVLSPQQEARMGCPFDATPAAKITDVVAAVLFVQFDDGTTWGDLQTGKQELLDERPRKLAFLKRLVDTYYESGEDAFNAILNDQSLVEPEMMVAMLLKIDAEYKKIPAIELAKKQLAPAQEWHASGIF